MKDKKALIALVVFALICFAYLGINGIISKNKGDIHPPASSSDLKGKNYKDVDKMMMEQVEQVLSELCAAHGWEYVSLLDVLQVGTDDYFPDQVHPTEQGSAKLWEAFGERLGLM